MALRMSQMLRSAKESRRPSAMPSVSPEDPDVPVAAPNAVSPQALPSATANPEQMASPVSGYANDQPPLEAFPLAPGQAGGQPENTELAWVGTAQDIPAQAPVAEDQPDMSGPLYQQLIKASEAIFKAAEGNVPDAAVITNAVRGIHQLLGQQNTLLSETVRNHKDSPTWPERSANTAILSMRLGMELAYDERRILALGLCALMHDLGMLTIPPDILKAPRLTPSQLQLVKNHPVESQKMVDTFGASFTWIGKIVVQVHERRDGSGYPQGLRGEQIRDLAGIIGLADTYEAMTHPRVDREARAVYHALKEIINLRNTLFGRRLVKALINIVSIFPLGSLVELNNSEIGRVVDTSRTHPTRPIIEVLLDARSQRVNNQRLIDLKNEPMLYIVDPAIKESVLQGK